MDIIAQLEQHAARRQMDRRYAIRLRRDIHAVEVPVYPIQMVAIPPLIVTTLAAEEVAVVPAQATRIVQLLGRTAVAAGAMPSANPITYAIVVKFSVVELVVIVTVILPVRVHRVVLLSGMSAGKVHAHSLWAVLQTT